MLVLRSLRVVLFASSALASVAAAQNPPPAASTPAETAGVGKRVYTPTDFARFAPRTAYDMLAQVPSFTIKTADTTDPTICVSHTVSSPSSREGNGCRSHMRRR